MERRLVTFIIITLLFFIFYAHLTRKYLPQTPPPPSGEVKEEESSKEEIIPLEEEQLEEVSTEKFVITFSLTGGYIKKIFIKKYQEELLFKDIGLVFTHRTLPFQLTQEKEKITLFNREKNIKKEFLFKGYTLTLKVEGEKERSELVLFYNPLNINRLEQRYQEFFYQNTSSTLKRFPQKRVPSKTLTSSLFGIRDRYFCLVYFSGKHSLRISRLKDNSLLCKVSIKNSFSLQAFIGPQHLEELDKYHLEEIVNYGFFHPIGKVLVKLLSLFALWTKNWGISIILLSAIIYLVLFPFTFRSTQAMRKMQALQPKIEELKNKYKDNPQKLNKEILELYRAYKVNPLGGCLPIFFQLPVFIALYQVLLRVVELKGAKFLWIKDLSLPDRILSLPFSLPFLGKYINLLPILIVVIGILQQKITSQDSLQAKQQKSVGLFFAVFIGIIFYNFPSALVLYWLMQNLFTLFYQWRISPKETS
ncbi:MAG: hypothetical protein DRP81_02325 [Candidatus Omnitrophota bacterium]|nr:MAG: hypothetical protein DRP72_01005 [Candidatus Omnitrophota bacterium]RKY45930.1 MAG: hypothetical protein DRP81_02325 [Candidatus Omnitrophota bacterium]HDN86117.1 membrane protein insertase YidC [Candidatus Omnitrophota bacterium]